MVNSIHIILIKLNLSFIKNENSFVITNKFKINKYFFSKK